MRRNRFQLLTAPGLPSWPKLYVNLETRRACVVARHPTWRSYQYAWHVALLLSWLGYVIAAVSAWHYWESDDLIVRISFTLISCLLLFPIIKFATIHGAVGFLARQVFPTRTTVWVSASGLAFRSRLYGRPIVIWRHWKGQAVRLSFILNRDDDATCTGLNLKPAQRMLQIHLNEAMILEIVVSSATENGQLTSNEQFLRRSIPMTEVSSRNARKFTTVFAAAFAITSKVIEAPKNRGGIDVDGYPTQIIYRQ